MSAWSAGSQAEEKAHSEAYPEPYFSEYCYRYLLKLHRAPVVRRARVRAMAIALCSVYSRA